MKKPDRPAWRDRLMIGGGGTRGVVAAACYAARTFGIRSAIPMFQARRRCPHAVIIPPDRDKYVRVGRGLRRLMQGLTPLIKPLSIDAAFVDLGDAARLHSLFPAQSFAWFAMRVETAIGSITVSIGLSTNKYLSKIASDVDRPRGFAVAGSHEAQRFLAPRPVTFTRASEARQACLARNGIIIIADLAATTEAEPKRRYGAERLRLSRLARGLDARPVTPERAAESLLVEVTFEEDIAASPARTPAVVAASKALGSAQGCGPWRLKRHAQA